MEPDQPGRQSFGANLEVWDGTVLPDRKGSMGPNQPEGLNGGVGLETWYHTLRTDRTARSVSDQIGRYRPAAEAEPKERDL